MATMVVAEVAPSEYVVSAAGGLDATDAAQLRDAVYPLAGDSGARVIVDLAGAALVDAATVRILGAAARLAQGAGGELVVVTSDPRTQLLLRSNGLDEGVRVEGNLVAAMDGAGGDAGA
jgi:anti-anti-sigma factor